jgi:hypothetical protein
MPPGHVVKVGLLSKGSEKTVTLTLGTMPDERQAMQPRRKRGTNAVSANTGSRHHPAEPNFDPCPFCCCARKVNITVAGLIGVAYRSFLEVLAARQPRRYALSNIVKGSGTAACLHHPV